MKLFESIYQSVVKVSASPKAPTILALLSFFESFILPYPPPDVMLAPMSLSTPRKAMYFALITLVASLLGGVVGYFIGVFAFDIVQPYLINWGYQAAFNKVMLWFSEWGFWAVLVAGFSPVPYKIFTVSAGALQLAFIPFLLASLIGRGLRFYLVALLIAKYGPIIEPKLLIYIERIGWAIVFILLLIIAYYSFL